MSAKSSSTSSAAQPPKAKKVPKPVPWRSMTAAERRVAVAKDVLAQLRTKAIEATPGTYMAIPMVNLNTLPKHGDLRTHLPDLGRCAVCARGAAFLGYVRIFDRVPITDLLKRSSYDPDLRWFSTDPITDLTEKLFGRRQAESIEDAFEQGGEDERAVAFGQRCPEAKARLRAIMTNIVANGGTFKP